MGCAVDFDNEAPLMTNEIDNVSANRCLSPKQKTAETRGAYGPPKLAFGRSHFST